MENKVEIVKKLEEAINLTRLGEVRLEYFRNYEVRDPFTFEVVGFFDEAIEIRTVDKSGEEYLVGIVNVSWDSGVALIRDVLRHDYFN